VLEHELAIIEQLGFPGYFLVVWELVKFCRKQGILCQGRGSAANSAVCYALGVTAVDAVRYGLLFERFLSPERDGPPDIDIDIESDRREEVIQHVYQMHGREYAAQVANVVVTWNVSARMIASSSRHPPTRRDHWAARCWRRSGRCWLGMSRQPHGCRCGPIWVVRLGRSTRTPAGWPSTC
jgi:error-prone DNA polymerase